MYWNSAGASSCGNIVASTGYAIDGDFIMSVTTCASDPNRSEEGGGKLSSTNVAEIATVSAAVAMMSSCAAWIATWPAAAFELVYVPGTLNEPGAGLSVVHTSCAVMSRVAPSEK